MGPRERGGRIAEGGGVERGRVADAHGDELRDGPVAGDRHRLADGAPWNPGGV